MKLTFEDRAIVARLACSSAPIVLFIAVADARAILTSDPNRGDVLGLFHLRGPIRHDSHAIKNDVFFGHNLCRIFQPRRTCPPQPLGEGEIYAFFALCGHLAFHPALLGPDSTPSIHSAALFSDFDYHADLRFTSMLSPGQTSGSLEGDFKMRL